MQDFVVSARKYRPSDFSSVVGQQSVTQTLKNAITNNQLAQAFLFCGPRGVGKTTCSRILAKTINCQNLTDQTEACDACESCVSFNEGKSLNIYELDAASNNSVDDIRSLIEQVQYPPQYGKYKVYIIDEVHMLSTAAFNAFLKTLEEPPKYAIFILATTEKHKILPTILSRCQIFDFKRIQIKDISEHLHQIAEKEQVHTEPEALNIIAQKADGALRDALSLFDQLSVFTSKNLTYELVIKHLNVLDYQYYFDFCNAFLKADIPFTLNLFNQVLEKGFDIHHFVQGLAQHYRDLIVAFDQASVELLEVGEQFKVQYTDQSKSFEKEHLLQAIDLVAQAQLDMRLSNHKRLQVELLLMKLCSIRSDEKKKSNRLSILAPSEIVQEKTESPKLAETQHTDEPVTTANDQKNTSEQTSHSVLQPPPLVAESVQEKETQDQSNESDQFSKNDTNQLDTPKEALKESKTTLKSTTISIQDFLNKKEQQEEKEAQLVKDQRTKSFSKQEFIKAWSAYKAKIQHTPKKSFYAILSQDPNFISDTQIEIYLDNSALQGEFDTEKQDLVQFLRDELSNDLIQIEARVKKVDKKQKLFTSKERFEKLAQINPNVQKLKDVFEIEIEI